MDQPNAGIFAARRKEFRAKNTQLIPECCTFCFTQ